jgi:hypothetical protein
LTTTGLVRRRRVHRALFLGLIRAALTGAITLATGIVAVPAQAAAAPRVLITGMDLHDGMILQHGGRYYMYGTEYKCGFQWGRPSTRWCGFGVATATSLSGPWSAPKLLFAPSAMVRTGPGNWAVDNGRTWNWVCGSDGGGCFNPRMLLRPDGVWVLWFNAPGDYYRSRANAYWVMGCNGPAGPCGSQAGAPHGSTHKPALKICADDGDFSVITSGSSAAIICSLGGLSEEQLAGSWASGTGSGTKNLARMAAALASSGTGRASPAGAAPARLPLAEGEGADQLPDGTWEMTYSLPGCGYCSGPPALKSAAGAKEVQQGYATAPAMMGPWTAQGVLSPAYCTGQPRTVFLAGGTEYEWVDRWLGTINEKGAAVLLEPMSASPWSCT